MHFGHVLTAMVTPFTQDNQVDFPTMTKLIEYLLDNGTEGLVVTGTTGESPTLSPVEMEEIYKRVVAVVNKRVPVLAGTGSNDTNSSVQLTKKATELGVDGIMLVAPYYNRPNQIGIFEHFKTIAAETDLPIMLYNIPSRCGVHIEAQTIVQLSEISNIVAVKEASGNLDQVSEIITSTKENFSVYSGDDSLTLPILSVGGSGIVSVASHIIGNELNQMVKTFFSGNVRKSAEIHQNILPIMKGLFMAPSPAPTKAALKFKGLDVGSVRLPLVDLSPEEQLVLKELIM
ncbi:4-hydroxy-tetrahydrodipicolinate synthase [Pseudogracilibacillus sp. SE30717A]|uniref:4-hydroxy-tetrahydrodipicolinate synthase n=1 Tax=Pseudogracilibacillus sp. SE30717A TaxID=3098293 RepID=UPI00300E286C